MLPGGGIVRWWHCRLKVCAGSSNAHVVPNSPALQLAEGARMRAQIILHVGGLRPQICIHVHVLFCTGVHLCDVVPLVVS